MPFVLNRYTGWQLGVPGPIPLAVVILTEFMDFVVVAKVAIVAIFPNVATSGIEERVVTPAIRELDTGEVSLRQGGLGLKIGFNANTERSKTMSVRIVFV